MKVCIAISTLSSGGAERNACLLANYLAKENLVTLLTFQKFKKCFYNIDKDINITNLNLLNKNKNFFFKVFNFIRRILILTKYFKKNKPEVVISFLETMNITILISLIFVKDIKVKIISDRNNPKKSERPLTIFFFKFLFYRFCDYLVLQTNEVSENYKFLDKRKIKIIQNFISEKIKIKRKYIPQKKIKIISVGRLEDQKGYDVLLKALKELKEKVNFSCDIYGKGSLKKKITRTIKSYKLSKHVSLLGVNKNILNLYHKYDIYVLSSKYEGFPNTLLESIAAGIFPIASDCDYGPKEIILKYKTGLIFRTNDSSDLYNKFCLTIKNKSKYFNLSKNLNKNINFKSYNLNKLGKWKKIIKKK